MHAMRASLGERILDPLDLVSTISIHHSFGDTKKCFER